MKKLILLITLLLVSISCVWAQEENKNNKKAFVKLGLWGHISTSGHAYREYTNNISLNLLAGGSKREHGFMFTGLLTDISEEAKGVQITGLYSQIAKGRGLAIGGVFNLARDYEGITLSAGFTNVDRMRGVQIGGFNNTPDMKGVQIGFGNLSDQMKGIQMGFFNVADTLQGVQIGVWNEIRHKGFQFGLINVAQHNDYPIGWINLIRDGKKGIGIEADELGSVIVNFRSGGRVLYGIVGLGYNFKGDAHHMIIQGGWGAHISIMPRVGINAELVMSWMIKANATPTMIEDMGSRIRANGYDYKSIFRPTFRILPAFRISKHFGIYGGPTLSYMQTKDPDNADLLRKKVLWSSNHVKSYKQLYIGYMGGVQYYF